MLPGMPVGTCRTCGAAVSYFARSCPTCGASNLPNPVVIGAALGGVALIGLAIVLGSLIFRGTGGQQATPVDAASRQAGQPGDQYDWLVTAMAECEEEAKRVTDKLYFLIAPLRRTAINAAGWAPDRIGMVGTSTELLPSANAVIGLRNGSLTLYREPLAFAVSDPASNTVYRWQPAVGVTVLTQRAGNFDSLKLGFQFTEGKDIEWGLTISLAKNTCYWIFPLIRSTARSG